jgi:hypothetical protein
MKRYIKSNDDKLQKAASIANNTNNITQNTTNITNISTQLTWQ